MFSGIDKNFFSHGEHMTILYLKEISSKNIREIASGNDIFPI